MILPKELFEQISHFEHSSKSDALRMYDVFTIHFKQWWKRKQVIVIEREIVSYNSKTDILKFRTTPSAADLYNQLNNWAVQTHEEKLDSVKQKYEAPKDGSNVVQLKPAPRDIDE